MPHNRYCQTLSPLRTNNVHYGPLSGHGLGWTSLQTQYDPLSGHGLGWVVNNKCDMIQ